MNGRYIQVVFGGMFCLGLLLFGCQSETATKISFKEIETPISLPQSEKKELNIAVSAMIAPKETFRHYQKILQYISEHLSTPVKLVQRETYAEVNELLEKEQIQAAFVCSGAYIDGHRKFGMELLVAPIAYGGAHYYSYIIVPVDSDVQEFKDLRGRKFAFTDHLSNTGKLVPTYMLTMLGETPDSFFSEYIFTYSHDKSIEAVAQKLVDGAAVDSLVWDYANATDGQYTSQTRIIEKSPPYGIPPVVVPKGLARETKESLRQVFLNMHQDDEGKKILEKLDIERFIVIEDSAYNSIRKMRKFTNKQVESER